MKRLAILLMLVAACESPTDPLNVSQTRPVTAYELNKALHLYAATAECLELAGQPGRVRWWIAQGITQNGEPILGGAQRGHDIWIAEDAAWANSIWKHESMHHILQYDPNGMAGGDHNHNHPLWRKCAEYFDKVIT